MPKDPVTFRLERDVRPLLQEAAQVAGLKISNYVEEAVLEKLGQIDRLRTSQEIELLRNEIRILREELSLATEASLVITGSRQPYSAEAAKKWVRTHLKTRNGGH
ncbi:MAG: hypothetical protein ABF384_19015 [Verrucomicrobiales bacterium]